MLKISDALAEIIDANSFLHFGLSHKLLNLSQTAEWMRPLVEVRLRKNISTTAILMALSRMGRIKAKILPRLRKMEVLNINVYNQLCELTFDRNKVVQSFIDKVYREVQKKSGYITVTQGTSEITLMVSVFCVDIIKKHINLKPKYEKNNLAALSVQFDPIYVENVGMIYALIQQLTLQNINIWELASTYTELIFYLQQKDIRLAFDTLYTKFGR